MIDLTKPLRTKTGCKAEIVATDLSGVYSLAVVVTTAVGSKLIRQYTETGHLVTTNTSIEDLENAPDEVWIPVFEWDGLSRVYGRPSFSSEKEVSLAYKNTPNYSHAVKIK